jgi:hypothetical protein
LCTFYSYAEQLWLPCELQESFTNLGLPPATTPLSEIASRFIAEGSVTFTAHAITFDSDGRFFAIGPSGPGLRIEVDFSIEITRLDFAQGEANIWVRTSDLRFEIVIKVANLIRGSFEVSTAEAPPWSRTDLAGFTNIGPIYYPLSEEDSPVAGRISLKPGLSIISADRYWLIMQTFRFTFVAR